MPDLLLELGKTVEEIFTQGKEEYFEFTQQGNVVIYARLSSNVFVGLITEDLVLITEAHNRKRNK